MDRSCPPPSVKPEDQGPPPPPPEVETKEKHHIPLPPSLEPGDEDHPRPPRRRPSPKGNRPLPPPAPPGVKRGDKKDPNVLLSRPGCRVERRQDGLVVKYGLVHPCEGDALKEARRLLGDQVPRVHDGYPSPYHGYPYIWMDYVEGDCLEDVWPTMSQDQKKDVTSQLGRIVHQMRFHELEGGEVGYNEPPEGWGIGSCGIVRDLRIFEAYDGGPCEDEASFNQFLLAGLVDEAGEDRRKDLARRLRSDHRICFTHADLSTRNIIVRDNKIQALIDWEYGGWYPEYWEYVKCLYSWDKHEDWKDYLRFIFPEQYEKDYKDEFHVYKDLRKWQKS